MPSASSTLPYSYPATHVPTPTSGPGLPTSGRLLAPPDQDRYEWNGAPLVMICHTVSVQCSQPEAPIPTELSTAAYYRLQVDNNAARFFLVPNPDPARSYWVVQYPSGIVETYGKDPGESSWNEPVDYESSNPANTALPVRWHHSRTVDPHGNGVFYRWTKAPRTSIDAVAYNGVYAGVGLSYLSEIYYNARIGDPGDLHFRPEAGYEFHVSVYWEQPEFLRVSHAPIWKATPDLRVRRIDIAGNPRSSEGVALGDAVTRTQIRRYHLDYLRESENGAFVPGKTSPLFGHSFLRAVQLEGRCEHDVVEVGSESEHGSPGLPEASDCPRMPATTLRYVEPQGPVTQRYSLALRAPRPHAFEATRRANLIDVNRDGWPDIVDGYQHVFQSPGIGVSASHPGVLNEGCVTSSLPAYSDPFAIAAAAFQVPVVSWQQALLDSKAGLTVNVPWYPLDGREFYVRSNGWATIFHKRHVPMGDWGRVALTPSNTPCTTQAGAPAPSFRFDGTSVGALAPNPPLSQLPTHDRVYIVGDIDGDGFPDGLVRAQESNDNSAAIRFSRRSGSHAGQVSVLSERVRTNINLIGTDCEVPSAVTRPFCCQLYPGTCLAAAPVNNDLVDTMVHTFADMNGDGVADLVASTELYDLRDGPPNPLLANTDVGLGYYAGDGKGGFECRDPVTGPSGMCRGTLGRAVVALPAPNTTPYSSLTPAAIEPTDSYGSPNFPLSTGPSPRTWTLADRRAGHNGVYFHDVNGDGYDDVIVPWTRRPDPEILTEAKSFLFLAIYLNHHGREFRRYCAQDPTGLTCDDTTDILISQADDHDFDDLKIGFADLNASGVADLVAIERDHVYAVDFVGGVRPGLLAGIDNGLGATSSIEYATYQRQAHDHGATSPDDRLERVTPVVTAVSESVARGVADVGVGAIPPRRARVEFRYSKPAFDPYRRGLRGFGQVTTINNGGSARVDEYYFGDCARGAETCASSSDDDPALAVDGRLVSSTVYAEDPKKVPHRVLEQNLNLYQVRALVAAQDGRRSWQGYVSENRKYLVGGSESRPTTTTLPVVEVFDGEVTGTRTQTVTLWGGRKTTLLRTTQEVDTVGNVTKRVEHGRVKGDPMLTQIDEPKTILFDPVRIAGGSEWTWRTRETRYQRNGEVDRVGRRVFNALGDVTAVEAYLQGSVRVQRFGANTAPDPVGASTDGRWVRLATITPTPTGAVERVEGASVPTAFGTGGACDSVEYDKEYGRLVEVRHHSLDGCGSNELVTRHFYDRAYGAITASYREAGLNISWARYDAFGRLLAVLDPSDSLPGVLSTEPRIELIYTDMAPLSRVELRERQPGHPVRISNMYVDGAGVAELTLSQANVAGATQWLATGLVERDGRGLPIVAYKAFEYLGSLVTPYLGAPSGTKHLTYQYDPWGRNVGVMEDSVLRSKVEYEPLRTTYYDAEDVKVGGPHFNTPTRVTQDGFGNVIEVASIEVGGSRYQTFQHNMAGEVVSEATSHSSRPGRSETSRYFDTLGRMTTQREPNTSGGGRGQVYAYNDAGWLVGTSDARGCGFNLHYDRAGRLVVRDESPCTDSQEPYSRPDFATGEGAEAFYKYDAPDADAPPEQVGEPAAFRGKLAARADRGAYTRYGYDVRGRATVVSRKVAKPGPTPAVVAARYTPHWFVQTTAFDDIDRVVSASTGADVDELLVNGKSEIGFEYDHVGNMDRVTSSYGALIAGVTRRIDGLPVDVRYGDAAETTAKLTYDDSRVVTVLREFELSRTAPPVAWSAPGYPAPAPGETTQQLTLAHFSYQYDEIGNPTDITVVNPATLGSAWAPGAKPASRHVTYDDAYRVKQVNYAYATGGANDDAWTAPTKGIASAVGERVLPSRVKQQAFEYDHLGNITSSTSDNPAATYDRHLGVQHHDPAAPQRLIEADGVKAEYDPAGNLVDLFVERGGPCDGGKACNQRFVYEWDESGRLATARRYDYTIVDALTPRYPAPPGGSPAFELQYKYSHGHRVLVSTKSGGSAPTHTLEVFGSLRVEHTELIAGDYERTPSNESVSLGGLGRVRYLAETLPDASVGRTRLFLTLGDDLGSVATVLDHRTGELVERVTYDANGGVESDYRPPSRWEGYREAAKQTGKVDDLEVGLTYFGARYFQPKLRRWMSPDPLRVHLGGADPNPYAYVGGRTLQAVDPLGLDTSVPGDERLAHEQHATTGDGRPGNGFLFDELDLTTPLVVVERDWSLDPRLARLETLSQPFVQVDEFQTLRLPNGVTVYSRDVPAHIMNFAPGMLLEGAFQMQNLLMGRLPGTNPLAGLQDATIRRVSALTHVDVPDRGPNDYAKAVAIGGTLLVTAAITEGVSAEGLVVEGVEVAATELVEVGGEAAAEGKSLLPGEGNVGTYDDLIAAGRKGDNITPHHIPSAKHMAQHGVARGDGIAINMEHPVPGVGGRHRATFTYGTSADVNMSPRDALAAGVRDARRIFQSDGVYSPEVRAQLQQLIRLNKTAYPAVFQ